METLVREAGRGQGALKRFGDILESSGVPIVIAKTKSPTTTAGRERFFKLSPSVFAKSRDWLIVEPTTRGAL